MKAVRIRANPTVSARVCPSWFFLFLSLFGLLAVAFSSCASNDNTYLGPVGYMGGCGDDLSKKENMLKWVNCVVLAEYVGPETTNKKYGAMKLNYKVIKKLYGTAEDHIAVIDHEMRQAGEQAVLFLNRSYTITDRIPRYSQVPELSLVLKEPNTDGPFNVRGKTDYQWFRVSQIEADIEFYRDIVGVKLAPVNRDAVEVGSIKEAETLADVIYLAKILYISGRQEDYGGIAATEPIEKLKGPKGSELPRRNFRDVPLPLGLEAKEYCYVLFRRSPFESNYEAYELFVRGYTAIPCDSPEGEYIRSLYGGTKPD